MVQNPARFHRTCLAKLHPVLVLCAVFVAAANAYELLHVTLYEVLSRLRLSLGILCAYGYAYDILYSHLFCTFYAYNCGV